MKNRFSNIFLAIFTFVLFVSIITYGAVKSAAASDAGYYVIDSIVQEGETYDSDDLEEYGINYYIVLHENGTMVINTDEVIKGTWKPGQIDYMENGEEVMNKYTIDKDTLSIVTGGGNITLYFKRSSDTPPNN